MNDSTELVCKHCLKEFKTQAKFEQHKCKQMKRVEDAATPTGIAAFEYFREWMGAQRRTRPTHSMFLHSRHFQQFLDFVEFAQTIHLTEPKCFIHWCVKRKYTPDMWCTSEIYGRYLEYLDALDETDVNRRLESSAKMLIKLAKTLDCEVPDVFEHIHPNDIALLIQTRKISPWLLLRSAKFKKFLLGCSEEEQQVITNLVRPEYWATRMQQNRAAVQFATQVAQTLQL